MPSVPFHERSSIRRLDEEAVRALYEMYNSMDAAYISGSQWPTEYSAEVKIPPKKDYSNVKCEPVALEEGWELKDGKLVNTKSTEPRYVIGVRGL